MKKGRISKEEHKFIESKVKTMTMDAIAKALDRNPESVKNYIKKHFDVGTNVEESAAYDLEDRPFWIEIQAQFTDDELKLFKYHWSKIVGQFNKDVLPTEELQILDVIKIELLMNRCLKTNKDSIEQINRLETRIEEITNEVEVLDSVLTPEEMENVASMERQIGLLRAGQDSMNKDYRDLQDKKAKMLREMKGTREQRVKRLEESKESFPSWVATLMQDPERLRQYGIQMEKMRLAMQKEKDRLSQYHKYEDGQIDQPFLNHESVMLVSDEDKRKAKNDEEV